MINATSHLDSATDAATASAAVSYSEPFNGLPSPRDFPSADVLIYDGKCNFCIGQVKNVRWFDGKHRVAFISLHDPMVAEQFPDLTFDQMMDQMYLVPASEHGYSDKRHGGAEAIRYLTRRLPKLWIFAPLLHFPFSMPIWRWGYRFVAKHRYKIAGKNGAQCDENGTCELHFGDKK
jgi:predicted DCC family thiol-disulfide oxidoreductase YuxK